MSEESLTESETKKSLRERLYMQDGRNFGMTLVYAIIGAGLFMLVSTIPMPFIMYGLFKFGLLPALAIIGTVAAFRGPLAGFLTGYLGVVLYDLVIRGTIVSMTLPALGYGFLGLVTGAATYDLTSGRSLIKLSVLSAIGFVFTVLIAVAVGLTVESLATMVVLGFLMLPLITMGLPSVILLTPVFARIWHAILSKTYPSDQ